MKQIEWSRDRRRYMTLKVKTVTQIHSCLSVSKSVGDKVSVQTEKL